MYDMKKIEAAIDEYVSFWESQLPQGPKQVVIINTDMGGHEHLRIFGRNAEKARCIAWFSHHDLLRLTTLLTRSLRAQTNSDHEILWTWCAWLANHYRFRLDVASQVLNDRDWCEAFYALVNSLVANLRTRCPKCNGAMSSGCAECKLEFRQINAHADRMVREKYLIAAPLSFAVLEGLIKRKASQFISPDGTVRQRFDVFGNDGTVEQYTQSRVSSLKVLFSLLHLNLFRGSRCPGFLELIEEIAKKYTPGEPPHLTYAEIYSWRNSLLHGADYWRYRIAIVMNLICLLVLDEIDATAFDSVRHDRIRTLEHNESYRLAVDEVTFPPDFLPIHL